METTSKKEALWVEPAISAEEEMQIKEILEAIPQNQQEEGFLDFLSNGQWVDEKKYGPQWRRFKCATKEDPNGKRFVENLVSQGIARQSPYSDSVRMTAASVITWRRLRGLPITAVDQTCPRFFGGVIEDDIWINAPLRSVAMITLGLKDTRDVDMIRKMSLDYGGVPFMGGDYNIIRIMCASSRPLIADMKKAGLSRTIRSTEVKRRELIDIPEASLNAMVDFYLIFVKAIVKSKMSVILKHVPREFFESQLYLWICDGIKRFDGEAGVPFGAYLTDRVRHWALDLAKENLDSTTASQQILAQKSQKIEGTLEEKAQEMGVKTDKLVAAIETSRRIYAMGDGALRLDDDSDDYAPLKERVSVSHEEDESRQIASGIHRRIIYASFQCKHPDKSLYNVIDTFYGNGTLDEHGQELLKVLENDKEMRRFVICN